MEDFQKEALSWPGKTDETVREKLECVLKRNPGWKTVVVLAKVFEGDSSNTSNWSYTPQEVASFKYLPIVSADVERSFSRLKLLLHDLRKSLQLKIWKSTW